VIGTSVDIGRLAGAQAGGFGLGVHELEEAAGEPGWRPALAVAEDEELLADLIERGADAAGTRSRAVAATWHLEQYAWHAAAVALGGVLLFGAVPPLAEALVRDDASGWIEGIAVPENGWAAGGGEELADELATHLAPLIAALARFRPAAALWLSAGDRLGQAAAWWAEAIGDATSAAAQASRALDAPTPLRATADFRIEGSGEVGRPRAGCCLNFRVPGGSECPDCSLAERRGCGVREP
jgi:hypothetical protein